MPAEHYVATPELRYVQRFVPAGDDPKIGTLVPVLQQRWVFVGTYASTPLNAANSQWRDVPLIYVDEDGARDNAESMAEHFVAGVMDRRRQGLPDYEKPPLRTQEAREADNVDIVQRLRNPIFENGAAYPRLFAPTARADMNAAADLIERLRDTLKTMARMCSENGGA